MIRPCCTEEHTNPHSRQRAVQHFQSAISEMRNDEEEKKRQWQRLHQRDFKPSK